MYNFLITVYAPGISALLLSSFKGFALYALINTMLTGLDVNRLFISQLIKNSLIRDYEIKIFKQR